jgi:hypothetical protein
MTDTTAAHAADTSHADAPHDEHHVHVYETSGIAEGNARVPLWLVAVMVTLFAFFFGYIVIQWSAQPTSARAK